MDIREIDGLWCDDITFCPERCGWVSCSRNKQNIRDRTIPHSFSVEIPQDCPKSRKVGEVEMKYPEYDSPFMLNICDITAQIAENIDEMSWQAVQRVGINVDKEKLLIALKQDAERYREAYANGYETGYTKRDEEIVRCQECKHCYFADNRIPSEQENVCGLNGIVVTPDWFCADGERKET